MPLSPRVGRMLYRAIQASAYALQAELTRYPQLCFREQSLLRAAAATSLPNELQGLLECASPLPLPQYTSLCARRTAMAAQAPAFATLDAAVGFAALRHLNSRLDSLRHLAPATTSVAECFGIRVAVASSFQGADRQRYFFRYRVRIDNASDVTVQLLRRAWTIRDLDGRVSRVEGPGVVGDFPTLAPTETFEYSSAVPLQTPLGTQSGHYVFVLEGGTPGKRMLQVPVAPFCFRSPSMDTVKANRKVAAAVSTPRKSPRIRRRRTDGRP